MGESQAKLAAYFDPADVSFKPQIVKGSRALAVAYIDARNVMSRLDAVLGINGWKDEYSQADAGAVICRLSIRIGGEWLTKAEMGGASDQPDPGDRVKAAVRDALKHAAVKFGVGRYSYRLPLQWCDYDPQMKKLTSLPLLQGQKIAPQPTPNGTPKPAPKALPAAKPVTELKDQAAKNGKIDKEV